MITDSQTNFLYLSDVLPNKYPDFYKRIEKLLHSCNINFDLLPKTKDVWAVDYMPIQVNEKRFVQFRYEPDYLREYLYLRTNFTEEMLKDTGDSNVDRLFVLRDELISVKEKLKNGGYQVVVRCY
jgi:hypothetical protein